MTQPSRSKPPSAPSTLTQARQARVLRALANRLDAGEVPLSEALEAAVVSELEDRIDVEAAREAKREHGSAPWEAVKERLGL